MIRLQDVASRAGVSVSTVSNVINGRTERMLPENLRRVQEAIAELGYHPNRAARFLKTGHTPLIGLLAPSISNPIYGSLAREVEVVAQEKYGYRVLVGNTYRDPEKEMSFLADMLSHGIRGVIIVSPRLEQGHFKESIKRGLVAVSYDRRSIPGTDLEVDYVSMDNVKAARIAVNHLIKNGHRRLAYVTAAGQTVSRMDKIAGFLAATRRAGLSASSEVIEGRVSSGYGDAEMAELGRNFAVEIAARKVRPTGIVALNDLIAIGLILGLQGCGLRVPQDISVVGIDDMFLSAYIDPGITTVRLPLKEMAQTMVSRILFRLSNPQARTEEFTFAPQLVERGSVAPLIAKGAIR
jgi:DNA-binding LacI/PurR family transcriptional regulator